MRKIVTEVLQGSATTLTVLGGLYRPVANFIFYA